MKNTSERIDTKILIDKFSDSQCLLDRDKVLYERQIKIVDAQIDRLVYELYGLTEEEIRLIGGA